jgi:hypothetical protein
MALPFAPQTGTHQPWQGSAAAFFFAASLMPVEAIMKAPARAATHIVVITLVFIGVSPVEKTR